MASVGFRNVGEEVKEYRDIDAQMLTFAVAEYARLEEEDSIYNAIMHKKVTLSVNGVPIHPDYWCSFMVYENSQVVITPALQGDKAGLLMIAVGVALIALSGPWGALGVLAKVPIGGGLLVIEASAAMMAAVGFSIALSGLASLLFQPDLPSTPTGIQESPTYSWSGLQTTARWDTPVPIMFGTHAVAGNIISAYTDSIGEYNYLHMLVGLGEGEIEGICQDSDHSKVCQTTDPGSADYADPAITINEQPMYNYSEVQWWYRTGTSFEDASQTSDYPFAQNKIPYFDGARNEVTDGRMIKWEGTAEGGIVYQTTKEVDMVNIQVRAPALYKFDNKGNVKAYSAKYKVEYKEAGSADPWVLYIPTAWECDAQKYNNDGTLSDTNKVRIDGYAGGVDQIFGVKPPDLKVTIDSIEYNNKDYDSAEEIWDLLYTGDDPIIVSERSYVPGSNERRYNINTTIEYLDNSGNVMRTSPFTFTNLFRTDHVIDWWGDENNPGSNNNYFKITHKAAYHEISDHLFGFRSGVSVGEEYKIYSASIPDVSDNGWIKVTAKTQTGFWSSTTIDFNEELAKGKHSYDPTKIMYDLRVSRKNERSTDTKYADDLLLHSVSEIVQGEFIYPNTALVGFRIRANEQLSGGLPNIRVKVKGKKVAVPKLTYKGSGAVAATPFDSIYYDEATEDWIDADASLLEWDESTYLATPEYSENSMMCVRDLSIADRYGLGLFLNAGDIDDSDYTVTSIKECHKVYGPHKDRDIVSWWDEGTDDLFNRQFDWRNGLNIDTSNRELDITTSRNKWMVGAVLKLDTPVIKGHVYQFSMTASVDGTLENLFDLKVKGAFKSTDPAALYKTGPTTTISAVEATGLAQTVNWTANDNYPMIMVEIKANDIRIGSSYNYLSGKISDVSLTGVYDTGERYHTYNGVLDRAQAGPSVIYEMCDSFRCWPVWFNGQYNFIVDRNETPVNTITMGNMISGSFSQSWTPLSEIPYRMVGQYTDETIDYDLRSLIGRSNDNTLTKSNEVTIGLKGITHRAKAAREISHKLTKVINCTHAVSFKMGADALHNTAGDVVNIQHDVPGWGQGGRLLRYNSASNVVVIDKPYEVSNPAADHSVQYQSDDNDFFTCSVDMSGVIAGDKIQTVTLKSWGTDDPTTDAVYTIGPSVTNVKPFRLLSTSRGKENEVEVTALEHLEDVYVDASIRIIDDNWTVPPSDPNVIPPAPLDVGVNQTILVEEGLGFNFSARAPAGYSITMIVVQMALETEAPYVYNDVAYINPTKGDAKYISETLEWRENESQPYRFKFYCVTSAGIAGPSIVMTSTLKKQFYSLPAPTGLRIKGEDVDATQWDGLHCTVQWNPLGVTTDSSFAIDGYTVEIFKDDSLGAPYLLRRIDGIKNCEYTYTFDSNRWDNPLQGPLLTPPGNPDLTFRIKGRTTNGVETPDSSVLPRTFKNQDPDSVATLTGESLIGGARFTWEPSREEDFRSYQVQFDIAGGGYSGIWQWVDSNSIEKMLTATQITDNGTRQSIAAKVRVVDWFDNYSASVETSLTSGGTVDNIFQIQCTTDGSGTCASLYDGDTDSGGVTI